MLRPALDIDLLPGRGIQRSIAPRAIKDNVVALGGLVAGLGQAIVSIRRFVLPLSCALAAMSQAPRCCGAVADTDGCDGTNARASAVNRLVGRVAGVCALPYPDTDLPNGVLTGNPLFAEVLDAVQHTSRDAARSTLGLPPDRFVVAVWAGSLGATRINTAVRELAELWRDRSDIAIHHVVGRRDRRLFRYHVIR
ncbi:MAG: hypothetical protein R2706_07160 [Acidimicrobiales bacterium]